MSAPRPYEADCHRHSRCEHESEANNVDQAGLPLQLLGFDEACGHVEGPLQK